MGSDLEARRETTKVKNVDYYEWKRAWTAGHRVDVEKLDANMEDGIGLHSYD